MAGIWSKTVDGAFMGGKWGMYAGAAVGAFAGLTAFEPQFVFDTFFLGPFGAAATLGVVGAIAGIAAGAAIGAVAGAVYGTFKSISSPSPHKQAQHQPERSQDVEPSRSLQQQQAVALTGDPPSTDFQDLVNQSRHSVNYNTFRGL